MYVRWLTATRWATGWTTASLSRAVGILERGERQAGRPVDRSPVDAGTGVLGDGTACLVLVGTPGARTGSWLPARPRSRHPTPHGCVQPHARGTTARLAGRRAGRDRRLDRADRAPDLTVPPLARRLLAEQPATLALESLHATCPLAPTADATRVGTPATADKQHTA